MARWLHHYDKWIDLDRVVMVAIDGSNPDQCLIWLSGIDAIHQGWESPELFFSRVDGSYVEPTPPDPEPTPDPEPDPEPTPDPEPEPTPDPEPEDETQSV